MFKGVSLACLTTGITWVGFLANRTDGLPVLETSKAAVFPNLKSIDENFTLFFELFEKQNVVQKQYAPHFNEIDGKKISSAVKLYSHVKDNKVKMLQSNELAAELHTVFEEYFNEISNENDKEMVGQCFVETRESKKADESLKKITRDLMNQIRSEAGKKLITEIQKAIQTGRGEVVLIVGKKGAGKSTFIDRFFNHVLSKQIKDKCLHLHVDLARFSGDGTIQSWITQEIKSKIFKEFYNEKPPTYDDLQGIFMKDYDRWRSAEHAHLYKKDKEQFKIEFGKYMAEQEKSSPYEYILKLLSHSVSARDRMPCIIFDNADQFNSSIQEELFQYSESLRRALPIVFVVMPITDKTAWEHTKGGPLESYKSKSFYLPVPATKDIFKKRIDYLKHKLLSADKKSGNFVTHNGYTISIPNVNAFAKCIEKIFVEKEYISKLLGGLSNFNIRKCLSLAHHAIASPHLGVEDLINAYLFDRELVVKSAKIKRAIMLGDYNFYKKQKELCVFNLFEIDKKHITSPLLNASILTLLLGVAHSAQDDIKDAYVTLEDIEMYFEPMSVHANDIRKYCGTLLEWGLIETYDPTNEVLNPSNEVAITHSGKLHLEMCMRDELYIGQMVLRTQIRCENTADAIKEIYMKTVKYRGYKDWMKMKEHFMKYSLEEDAKFIQIPEHEDYKPQRMLRNDLHHESLLSTDLEEAA